MQCSMTALSTMTICAPTDIVAEVPLQSPQTAVTLYWKNGKVATTDGPYAETKEQLGGLQIIEARDLNHAIQLVSQLPGFKYGLGPIEIRPVADMGEAIKASEQRRGKGGPDAATIPDRR